MHDRKSKGSVEGQIDENLRKIFEQDVDQDLPERLRSLLDDLDREDEEEEGDGGDQTGEGGQNGARSANSDRSPRTAAASRARLPFAAAFFPVRGAVR